MVSIIIPAYNAEKVILRCLNSCIRQSYRNIEIIVVDDGSIDNTIDQCKQIKDSRLKIILKQNAGVSEARNTGIEAAKGEYIFFLDADDYLEKNCCATMVSAMSKEVDLVVCGYYRVSTNDKKEIFCSQEKKIFGKDKKNEAIKYLKDVNGLFTCWNKLYRKEKIQSTFDPQMSFAEDSVFVFDYIAISGKIIVLDYTGYNYWISTEGSAMKRFHPNMVQMLKREYSKIIDSDRKSEDIKAFAATHYIENVIYWCIPQLISDKRYSVFQKREIISQIWEIEFFDDLIMKYKPERRLHYMCRFLMKHKSPLLLMLLFTIVN